ncbi:NfeD family protein [Rhodalgimonas zhirmunskyi]|uniref:NfeD family protein n=1 Tax=Rhodalgimonas zhirmunskyi TaxID=2964767 RepID=A0AAJ1X6W4_9RHOB|nr:hypothetical protein [Rhodoalgimonas zhirmunskyi]MDQ2093907.1 hypothetical protein [Rhodoalgimonas zhirmunskyi]
MDIVAFGWDAWWAWMAAGLALAIFEVLAPGFIFLGFAIGAGVVGVILLIGGGVAAWLSGSVALLLVVFAALSLIAWLVLRRVVGVRTNQTRYVDRDINDD